jgi:transcriptional regulator GlxA family with amidase domain
MARTQRTDRIPPTPRRHRVGILAFDGVALGDLAVPCELFARAVDAHGAPLYDVRVCATTERIDAGFVALSAPWRLPQLARCDTVIVPGLQPPFEPPPAVVQAVRRAIDRGSRVASICSGAFIVAATGRLDGLRATTHWAAAALLAERHPALEVDPNVLYVDHGRLLSSAGAAAAHDLCLHLIRRDHGAAVAAEVARLAVMPLERAGGQAQFIVHVPPAAATPARGPSMNALLAWLDANLARPLPLSAIARHCHMSGRSLHRHFSEQVGMSPARWLVQARVRRAQALLEATDLPVERIATDTGFGSAVTLRQRFTQLVGTGPLAYRKLYRGRPGTLATIGTNPSA